jgi:hypothetical protein
VIIDGPPTDGISADERERAVPLAPPSYTCNRGGTAPSHVLLKSVGRQANAANRFAGSLRIDSAPCCGEPQCRCGTLPTDLGYVQNIHLSALVLQNQGWGESAQRHANHNRPSSGRPTGESFWRK